MDIELLKKCKKSPSAGGFSRSEANKIATDFGIDPSLYKRKEDLCQEIVRVAEEIEKSSDTPSIKSPVKSSITPSIKSPVKSSITPSIKSPVKSSITPSIKSPVKSSITPSIKSPVKSSVTPSIKSLSSNEITNNMIAEKLRELAIFYESKGDEYRARTFRNSASIIEKMKPITSINDLKGIPKIGEGTRKRVAEILETGKLEEISDLQLIEEKTEEDDSIDELSKIYGIGKVTAKKLYLQGVKNIDDLVEKVNDDEISLTKNQEIGLIYYLHFLQKIPREEVSQIGNYVIDTAKTVPGTKAEIVGSYRRGRPESGDIDILFTHKDNFLHDLVDKLEKNNLIEHVFSLGPVKFQGTYFSSFPEKNGILRKIDIRYVPPENWGASLVHATGSDNFNILIRQNALDQNLSLSEHGLLDLSTNERINVPTEEDVFRIIGIDYLEPTQRDLL